MYATPLSDKKNFQASRKNYSVNRQLELKSHTERNLAIVDEINKLIGDDIPWTSEEEMIRELADMRRRNSQL